MNQESIEKNYFQNLNIGHYIDVKYSDQEWKIAKIIERDKRNATIAYDGINSKQEQVYLLSYKVAPLRTHTEGYTGSVYKVYRPQMIAIKEYMNHLQIMKSVYNNQNLPSAMIITEYLRGELFVLVHALLCKQDVKEQQAASIVTFLIGFIDFMINMASKVKKLAPEYFQIISANKSLYLVNEKVAFVHSLTELLILLNLILKVQNSRHVNLFKNKFIDHNMIIKFFRESKCQRLFQEIFNLNDGNGKWLPFGIHKQVYYLLKKGCSKFTLPEYKHRDHQEILQIYPFIIKQEQKSNTIEIKYINFIISILKEQSTFQAKLKALQEFKKIVQSEIQLYTINDKQIFNMIEDNQVIQAMINQYTFNPEIFKRFIPILAQYCKNKQLSNKNIIQLFKLANNRHESEVSIIHEIVCSVAEFVPVNCLDSIYAEIIKNNLNQEHIIKFVKNFTINAIKNFSKEKSFLSSFFKRTKNSSKYGYYGLDLFYKQSQDDGVISKQNLGLTFDMIQQIFSQDNFQGQRFKYIQICISWLDKSKNYGQSIKLIDKIISTYPSNTYFEQSKKQVIQKLIQKYNLLQKLVDGLKWLSKSTKGKVIFSQSVKWMYEFIDNYFQNFISSIKIQHIEFLWSINQNKLLSEFIKKSRYDVKERDSKESRRKWIKRLDIDIQQSILLKIVRKPKFYERQLNFQEFQALDEVFISNNLIKKKIQVSQRGCLRYITPQMEGYEFYFQFIKNMAKTNHIDKILKKTFLVFLRPKDQRNIQTKINCWRLCLLKVVDKLKQTPEVCLKSINMFFDLIQGILTKENVNSANIDICVSNDNKQKVFTMSKNSTLFKIRKQIMIDYGINGDFSMYSTNMRRDITFQEEQEFSLNALPQEPKGPSILVLNRKKQKHPQMIAVEKFRQIIERQQNLYKTLFSLDHSKINEYFWKTMDIMPVNKELVKKIQNCTNFTLTQWRQILNTQTKESLQYHLNIIYNLMQKNKKWISLFQNSEGMSMMKECLSNSLDDEELNERIINRCIMIIIKIINVLQKIEEQQIIEIHQKIAHKLSLLFSADKIEIKININLLNNIFKLESKLSKMFQEKLEHLQLDIMLKILVYGIFQAKTKISVEFIQTHFEHYLINHYNERQNKIKIFEYLIGLLHFQTLQFQDNCELFFIFLIDYMNTFIQEEQLTIQKRQYMTKMQNFVFEVLQSKISDQGKYKYNELLYGTFKLLMYTLNFKEQGYDLIRLFKLLMNQFLFSNEKRVKHEITTKITYECVKKILFMGKELIFILSQYISPQLQHNQWRKNTIQSWMIQSKRQERNVFCGLENLGATCYINCLFQQLFHIEHFRENYLSIESTDDKPLLEENQNYQLQWVFSALKYSNKRSISIRRFCQSFITYEGTPINPMVQSDSDQFFNALIEKLQMFLKKKNRYDIIEDTFQGKLSNQLNCEGCPHKSEKQQNFHSIGVNIRGKKCLEQALDGYIQGQILDGDNAYFCQICQKKVRTQKRLCIKALPNILVIILKRFQFNYDEMKKIKINTFMSFPHELNMKKYTAEFLAGQKLDNSDDQYGYSLRGTVIHSGTSQAGHYYSFIKSKDKWHSFNDEYVEEINIKRLQEDGFGGQDKNIQSDFKYEKNKNAYILFYEKNNPSEKYHKNQPQIVNDYTQLLKKQIMTENSNADFLSIMLDSNFLRLCQNINCLDGQQSYKFTMLYFHTVVLRDKFKEEYLPNYYRIIETLLQKEEISQWYLNQMNQRFFKEFLIQAPKFIRFTCVSLVMQAIKVVKYIPDLFFINLINCLRTKGMSPFAKVFKKLSENYVYREKLIQFKYPERVISLLLQQNYVNVRIESQASQSYFGHDNSQKDKQTQMCPSFLIQSLKYFDVQLKIALKIFQKHFSRNGTKVIASIISKDIEGDELRQLIKTSQAKILRQGNFKKDDLQKYLFLIRYLCLKDDDSQFINMKICLQSLKGIMYESRNYYEPMELLIKQVNYIAFRNANFVTELKMSLIDKANSFDYMKSLKYWLKQAEKPHTILKSEDYRRKLSSLSIQQKGEYELTNKLKLDNRLNWILSAQKLPQQQIQSDIQTQQCNKQLQIRSKRFKVRYHLGLIKRVEHQGQQKWAILQKNELDLYCSL